MKNKKIILILIILISTITISTIIYLNNVKNNKENDINNNTENNLINSEEDKIIYIVKDEEKVEGKYLTDNYDEIDNKEQILGQYGCSNCSIDYGYLPSPPYHFVGENSVLISVEDTERKIIQYNYITKNIENTYQEVLTAYELNSSKFAYLVYRDGKYAILGQEGKLLTKFEYDNLPASKMHTYFKNNETMSTWNGKNTSLRVEKNNMIGIVDASTGKTIIEFGKYEDIIFSPNGNYSIKENNKWYLLDNQEKRVLNEGYDGVFGLDFGILTITKHEKNKAKIQLIDYKGNKLTNSIEYVDYVLTNETNTYKNDILYEIDDNKITFISSGIDRISFEYSNNELQVIYPN